MIALVAAVVLAQAPAGGAQPLGSDAASAAAAFWGATPEARGAPARADASSATADGRAPRSAHVDCPPGTTRKGAPPPDDYAEWCERPGLDGRGRREGTARSWYDDGALAVEDTWRDGDRDGPFVEYHRNGRKAREGAWAAGRKEGTWTVWFDDGRVEERSTWRAGVADGAFVAYHRSGAKRSEGRHCGGAQCGTWRTFDEDGREIGVVRYEEQRAAP